MIDPNTNTVTTGPQCGAVASVADWTHYKDGRRAAGRLECKR